VYDRLHAAQRMAERRGVGEVAERDLDADPRGTEPARIAHEASHCFPARREPRQEGRSDPSGGAGEQEHGPGA
jgi:hypothetical protein